MRAPTEDAIEKCRSFWETVAAKNGWLKEWEANGKRIEVWYNEDGEVVDSIYLNREKLTDDVIMLYVEEEL